MNPASDYREPIHPIGQNEGAESIKEAHLRMIKNAQQAGRQIPAVPVDPTIVGKDLARTSVEASQRTMRLAARRSFIMPAMPWHRRKEVTC